MKVICCSTFHQGDRLIGEKPPFSDPQESHGLCPDCLKKEEEKFDREMAEYEIKEGGGKIKRKTMKVKETERRQCGGCGLIGDWKIFEDGRIQSRCPHCLESYGSKKIT